MPSEPKHPSKGGRTAAERQFVDREEFVAPVQSALKEPPRTRPLVLVFHGGAGIGKSRLRREMVRQLARDPGVLTATLDFDVTSHRHPETALFFLRKTLGEAYGVRFPGFELAYAVYWQQTHPDTPMGLARLSAEENRACTHARSLGEGGTERETVAVPSEELRPLLTPASLLAQLLDESGRLPLIGLVPRIAKTVMDEGTGGDRDKGSEGAADTEPLESSIPRPLDSFLREWWNERGERELEDIPQMEPGEIIDHLPKLWASDLKDHLGVTSLKPQAPGREEGGERREASQVRNDERRTMNEERAPRRAVLFIDSYEKLWDVGMAEADFFKRDEWLRELVTELPEVLWVICGRQKLRWAEVEPDWGKALSQHQLEPLPEQSARRFLESCDITDGQIQDAIVRGSQGVPHYLDLAVDTIQSSEFQVHGTKFQGNGPDEMVAEFTRQLDKPEVDTLSVLSATRFWYYGLFEDLVTQYRTGYPLTGYDDLARFSFIKDGAAPGTRTMHELMREALQENQPPELRKSVHQFLFEYYAKQITGLKPNSIADQHRSALVEAFYHGRQAMTAGELWLWLEPAVDAFDYDRLYRLLTPFLRDMVHVLDAELGPAHISTGRALIKLGRALRLQAEYDEAELLLQRELEVAEKEHGPEHPLVMDCLRELAYALLEQARYAEAEVLCRRVVGKREDEPVTDAHVRIVALDGLVESLSRQRKYAEAEELYRRALAVRENSGQPEDFSMANLMGNMSDLLYNQARYSEAEPLARRAVEIAEKVLGPNHPRVSWPLGTLGAILLQSGRQAESEPLFRRALKLKEDAFGPGHVNTAESLNNLAAMLFYTGRLAEAEALQRRALAVYERKMGASHPSTVILADTLIHILTKRGDHAGAEPLALRAIGICEKERGPGHPETARALNTAGVVCTRLGRYAEAESFLRRGLDIRRRVLGAEHRETLRSLDDLAVMEHERGRYAEAESLFLESLEKQERVMGPEHPNVACTVSRLAAICSHDGRHTEAEALRRRVLAIREKVDGPNHPFTAEALDSLARACEQTGRAAEARELAARAKSIRAKNAEVAQAQAPSPS